MSSHTRHKTRQQVAIVLIVSSKRISIWRIPTCKWELYVSNSRLRRSRCRRCHLKKFVSLGGKKIKLNSVLESGLYDETPEASPELRPPSVESFLVQFEGGRGGKGGVGGRLSEGPSSWCVRSGQSCAPDSGQSNSTSSKWDYLRVRCITVERWLFFIW